VAEFAGAALDVHVLMLLLVSLLLLLLSLLLSLLLLRWPMLVSYVSVLAGS